MKKIMLLSALILFLFTPLCIAEGLWFYDSQYLVLDTDLSTSIDVISVSPFPEIEFISANISFFPKDVPGQDIISRDFEPEPVFIDGTAVFEWRAPGRERLDINMDSRVRTENDPVRVYRKVDFPIQDLPNEFRAYTEPAEIINIDDDIIAAASEIASGKDDLVDVVDSVAWWVNTNIEYNLSTLTAEASQNASWVLKNRRGVCDELTSLFISMLRSLGIPARFAAGISYTNAPSFDNDWGPHGWAEVYFPGYGWIPYDVTYGEYGWVEPTHMLSHSSDDAGKVVSNYQWKAESGVSLDLKDLEADVNVVEIGSKLDPDISIDAGVFRDSVSFGSFNIITATLKNMEDFYVSKDVYLSRVSRVSVEDDIKQHVLLRPGEIKEVRWVVKVNDGLDEDYIYTFPFMVYTLENISAATSFNSVENAEFYSAEDIEDIVSSLAVEDSRAYSRNLEAECLLEKDDYYVYESPVVQCSFRNVGNIFLKDLNICLEDECARTHIGITQQKTVNFTPKVQDGENDLVLSVSNDQISKEERVVFGGLDAPKLNINDLDFPREARYNDRFNVMFRLEKQSSSEPLDIKTRIRGAGINEVYGYDSLDKDVVYNITLKGRNLDEGPNPILIGVQYKDRNGRAYSESEDISISLVDVTFFQRIMLFVRGIFR